ncbi:MAG: DUF2007 domain-containing protein [Rikenellaceae bacterium]
MSEVKMDHQTEEMVVFNEYNSLNEAEVIKSVLDSAGIWSMINNEYMSTFYPVGVISAQIIVRKEDFERAQELVQS